MARTWTLTVAAALATACATARFSGGPESPMRLDTQPAVGWEPEGPFKLDMVVYNATGHRIDLVEPKPEALQVKIFRATDGQLACKTPQPTRVSAEGWEVRSVRDAAGMKLSVDVWPYCRSLTEGVYRYEAVFVANNGNSGSPLTGSIGPQGGQIVVQKEASHDEAMVAAALEAASAHPSAPAQPTAPQAAAEAAPAPAEQAAGAQPAASQPAPQAPPAASPANPEAVRACVDKELAAHGLNAYGDPQGTRYDDRPPVDEGGRILYVASRNPAIRVACKIPGF